MADFAAVLRKTLEGLGDTTPAMRARVYDKARSTIATKLAALNPPPPAAVAERQRQSLEDAIASVERSFAAPAPKGDPLDELENVFSSINAQRSAPPPLRTGPPAVSPYPAPAPKPAASFKPPAPAPQPFPPETAPEPEAIDDDPTLDRLTGPEAPALAEPDRWDEPKPKRRRGAGRLLAAVLVLAVLGGGAYAVWLNADEFQQLTGISLPGRPAAETPVAETPAPSETTTAAQAPADEAEEAEAPEPAASPPPASPPSEAAAAPPAQTPPKFTQRLDANGAETDAGSAGGGNGVGEGTSVAQATTPPAGETGDTPPLAPGGAPPAAGTPPAGEQPSSTVAVGQRAIFYEERTNTSPGSAETGSIVWTTVQESPGGDLPPEAAIRAEATIPGKDMQLRMTIRRNADRTLPASHIIELIFLTPNATGPDAIDNVLRVSMKGTEQDPGSPLLGNSAKIADGYFLVALDDGTGQSAANLALLRQQDWIDVPVIYKSGRRALFTMEKGLPGEKVFDDALKAWQQGSNG